MKLVEVMACVDRVAKNGNNTTQNYKYAMAADVYDAVRAEMAKRFVLMVPHLQKVEWSDMPTRSGVTHKLCTVHVRFDFTDAESGEVVPVEAFGQGSDSGDKAGYKAMTGATKSCLVQTFLIPTGDDPENEKAAKPIPPPPAGAEALKQRMKESIGFSPPPTDNEPPPPTDADFRPDPAPGAQPSHDRNFVFPFSNKNGEPLHKLSEKSLKWFQNALTQNINDPSKARFADTARAQLALVNAELKFRGL